MSFVDIIFHKKTVQMECECDSIEKKNRVIFLLFLPYSCYMRKLLEGFTLLFALLVIPILAHTCWGRTFLSRERTVHYTIVLIPTVLIPYVLVSNYYLVAIFFIRIIHEKFKFTSHAHSWSFTNINHTLSTWLRTCHIVILLLSRKNEAQMKKL